MSDIETGGADSADGSSWEVVRGDSLDVLKTLPEASVDSVVTDPPAGISFMSKAWDDDKGGRKQWIAWMTDIMTEALRVLKPGGHALVWAIPRTSHWTATAVEDAGFEVRDVLTHLFGTGFPKSLDVSKAIDKAAGAERPIVGSKLGRPGKSKDGSNQNFNAMRIMEGRDDRPSSPLDVTAPATEAAKQWEGWGTALKPASEHWILARKPLEGTVAANVIAHGVGGLNIDGCRIHGAPRTTHAEGNHKGNGSGIGSIGLRAGHVSEGAAGRWPANVVLDEEAAALLDEQSGQSKSGGGMVRTSALGLMNDDEWKPQAQPIIRPTDSGGASRFFYVAKPSTKERDAGLAEAGFAEKTGGELTGRADGSAGVANPRAGRGGKRKNVHPTVKSVALMTWLVRLITPAGGLVLDPFCGSGSTGCAAVSEGFDFLGIEREEDYAKIAEARIAFWAAKGSASEGQSSEDEEDAA